MSRRAGESNSGRDTSSRNPRGRPKRMPRPPPTALDHPNYSFHDDHLLRKPPTVHHQLIDVHPRRGLLSRTRDIPVPIGAVRAPGRAAAGQLEIVQGLARALEDRHGHELREHVVDLQRDPRPVTIREQVPAQDERDRGRRVKRVRVVLLELHDGWRGLAPRAAHRRPSRPKPEPQHCPGVLHPPLLCERDRCLNRSPCYGSPVVLHGAREKLCATAPGCQPRERPRVAGAAGDAAPIGPFEQGNQILAREPEALTHHRRRGGTDLRERRFQSHSELLQRRLGSVALLVHLLDPPLPDQMGEQRPHRCVRKFPDKLGDRGNLPAGCLQATDQQGPGVRGPGVECRLPPRDTGHAAGQLPRLLSGTEVQDLVNDGGGGGGGPPPRRGGLAAPPPPPRAPPAGRETGSSPTPPPIVVTGEKERSTKRSPPRATRGVSNIRRTGPRSPGAIGRAGTARASTTAVPWCTRRRVRAAIGRGAPGRSSTAASSTLVAAHPVPVTATWPRSSSSLSTPTSASAVRRPGAARCVGSPWTSIERTRASRSRGSSRTDSPTPTEPLHVDPVTTVPAPATAKTRSIGRRKRSSAGRSTSPCARRASVARSSSNPAPLTAEVATGGSH